ncbi:hypothetical protein BGZ96_012310 [Linnemannia gamsii]|uniref:F-box domain-containing protein n=1 Tax=Linnemannia gamsii TaxID=64522 RepID=A0ABQ7KBK3_9FUNG|nr:hypothetical protein BGZ96_012310 [Linnemannia gamsii]
MPPSFPLPLECLQLIIRQLVAQSASYTLASLLRVNKYVCSATLPIMYEDPFPLPVLSCVSPWEEIIVPIFKLMKTLLLSLPEGHQGITDLMRAAYLTQECTGSVHDDKPLAERPTSIPYYSFFTNVDFRHNVTLGQTIFQNLILANRVSLNEHLKQHGQNSRYLLEEVPFVLLDDQQRQSDSAVCKATVHEATSRDLRCDVTWALCSANAELIRELVIPIMDIGRYVTLVPRLKVLSKVIFLLDKGFQTRATLRRTKTLAEEEQLEAQRAKRNLGFEEAVSFVQGHRQLFPHALKIAQCHKNPSASHDDCPEEYNLRILKLLPPLNKPAILDQYNWTQFVAKAQDTDLSLVKTIRPWESSFNQPPYEAAVTDGPFLHRCRVLEIIEMCSLADDAFQWAVDERKQHEADLAAGRPNHQRRLVPLRSFDFDYQQPSFGRQVNDVAFAFNRTLEKIRISGNLWTDLTDDERRREFLIGGGVEGGESAESCCWDLPQLSELKVCFRGILVRIHPDVVSRCPRLSHLLLTDYRVEYSLNEVVYWTLAELPQLEGLSLMGSSAIAFHPEILHSTTQLKDLALEMPIRRDGSAFIPPVADFGHADDNVDNNSNELVDSLLSTCGSIPRKRPTWTWDWDLPNLVHLKLNAEFGYRFQFKMLEGTPNLERFSVDCRSLSGEHRRTVGIVDLIKPGYRHPDMSRFLDQEQHKKCRLDNSNDNDNGNTDKFEGTDNDEVWREFEYIHVPVLRHLTLAGPWSLDGRVLEALFDKMTPGLQYIQMSSRGHSVREWVKLSSEYLLSLCTAQLFVETNIKAVTDAGLKLDEAQFAYELVEQPDGRREHRNAKYHFLNVI